MSGHVVVTGGAGFIGSHTVVELRNRGHRVTVIDPSSGTSILDDDFAERCADADAVIHLAGMLGTAELFDRVEPAIEANVVGTVRVLDACRKHGLAFVGITMPSVWANVYQATKQCARKLASAWHESHGVPVSHVRAFNVYGAGQKVNGVQKIIPTFAHRAWRGLPLPVWGDGFQTVDLVHVSDVARMLCDAMAFGGDEVFDAGTGIPVTVGGVARAVIDHTGGGSQIEYLPMRAGERPDTHIVAEGDGWELLDWRPPWDMGAVLETVDWYRVDRP